MIGNCIDGIRERGIEESYDYDKNLINEMIERLLTSLLIAT